MPSPACANSQRSSCQVGEQRACRRGRGTGTCRAPGFGERAPELLPGARRAAPCAIGGATRPRARCAVRRARASIRRTVSTSGSSGMAHRWAGGRRRVKATGAGPGFTPGRRRSRPGHCAFFPQRGILRRLHTTAGDDMDDRARFEEFARLATEQQPAPWTSTRSTCPDPQAHQRRGPHGRRRRSRRNCRTSPWRWTSPWRRSHAGGRLIYVGAGTSGRLGVLDASGVSSDVPGPTRRSSAY